MLYIYPNKNDAGGHFSPQSTPAPGLYEFPEEFLDKFVELNGFVKLTIVDNVVTAIRANNTAREAYFAEIEAAQAEQTPAESPDSEVVTWAELDAAYNEGRDTAYDE